MKTRSGGPLRRAASTEFGLGSGKFVQPPRLAARQGGKVISHLERWNFKDGWWSCPWSTSRGHRTTKRRVLAEIKGKLYWTHSQENQGLCSTKSMIPLWFVHVLTCRTKTAGSTEKQWGQIRNWVPKGNLRKNPSIVLQGLIRREGWKEESLALLEWNSNSFWAEVGLEGNRELATRYVIEDAGHAEPWWELCQVVVHTKKWCSGPLWLRADCAPACARRDLRRWRRPTCARCSSDSALVAHVEPLVLFVLTWLVRFRVFLEWRLPKKKKIWICARPCFTGPDRATQKFCVFLGPWCTVTNFGSQRFWFCSKWVVYGDHGVLRTGVLQNFLEEPWSRVWMLLILAKVWKIRRSSWKQLK